MACRPDEQNRFTVAPGTLTGNPARTAIWRAMFTPVAPSGRVQPGLLAGRKVLRTVYRGGYENLGAAWGEFETWIAANGHTTAPDLWESYLTGPDLDPDPATYTTELNHPLKLES